MMNNMLFVCENSGILERWMKTGNEFFPSLWVLDEKQILASQARRPLRGGNVEWGPERKGLGIRHSHHRVHLTSIIHFLVNVAMIWWLLFCMVCVFVRHMEWWMIVIFPVDKMCANMLKHLTSQGLGEVTKSLLGVVWSHAGCEWGGQDFEFPTSITRVAKNTIKGKAKFMPAQRTLSIIFFWPEKHKESPNTISSCIIVLFLVVNWNEKLKWKLNFQSIRNNMQ